MLKKKREIIYVQKKSMRGFEKLGRLLVTINGHLQGAGSAFSKKSRKNLIHFEEKVKNYNFIYSTTM